MGLTCLPRLAIQALHFVCFISSCWFPSLFNIQSTTRRRLRRLRALARYRWWQFRQGQVQSHLRAATLRWIFRVLSSHHSRDGVYLNVIKNHLKKVMASQDKAPWRCGPCRRLIKSTQLYCPSCGGWWEEVVDSYYVHQPRAQHWEDWQWKENAREAPRSPRRRSSSARQRTNRKGKGKELSKSEKGVGKEGKGKDVKGAPSPFGPAPYMQSGTSSPWPQMDFSPFQTSPPGAQPLTTATTSTAASTAAGAQDLVQALRRAYQDGTAMPTNVREILEKIEVADARQVTKDLHTATTALGKARRSHQEAADSKKLLRTTWMRHLEESARSWANQLEHFRASMATLHDQEAKALQEVSTAQKLIQQLNVQGGMDQALEEQPSAEPVENTAMDAEEEKLRKRVHNTMKMCLGALGNDVHEISDEDKDKDAENPSKRARSADPPAPKSAATS